MNSTPLWEPTPKRISASQMFNFMKYVNKTFDLSLSNYQELHKWSVDENLKFWDVLTFVTVANPSP